MDRPSTTKSYRSAVCSTQGMCATSQPLATLSGIEVLRNGGSAADAAICMLNTLTVVEPHMNGLGGDMFGLYFDSTTNELVGLNSSGSAPAGLNIEMVLSAGGKQMPTNGPLTITVPGALGGLVAFHQKYGKLSWEDLFHRAIEYAEGGFPVTEIISYQWNSVADFLQDQEKTAEFYLPYGRAPRLGEIFINRSLAKTLSMVAKKGSDTFYHGKLAKKICQAMADCGSPLSVQDLANFTPEWVTPMGVNYMGHDVYELPPNCQGVTVLAMLRAIEEFDLKGMGLNSSAYIHTLVEAKKFSYSDRDTKLGDPRFTNNDCSYFFSDERIASFRKTFDPQCASNLGSPDKGTDTVYVVAVDKDRNVASFISSIFEYFGSGIVAGDTGIIMQNRGSLFSLDRENANCLEPGKRPLHTIIPAMVLKDGRPQFAFGVMGGHMQPQGHVQIMNNIYAFGLGVQEASDQPRFFHNGIELCLESAIPYKTRRELIERGHKVGDQVDVYGGFQGIMIDHSNGVLIGGSDMRKDGCAIGY